MKNLKSLVTSKTIGARLIVAIIALVIVTSLVTTTAYMQSGKREVNSKPRIPTPSKIIVGAGASKDRPAAIGTCDTGMNIDVEATGGTAQTGYASLNAAFAAINGGTHTGVINIEICASETEPAGSAVLNSSGAGSASYTSINIYPLMDGLTISGASATGRGVIELNGADNVTINGDNPNTGGTNRNLTIQNTATATTAFTSVIRIALATSVVTSADNVSIRNLNLVGNATGRNISGATSTAGSENTTYGVLATAGASTVLATTAPSAISSVSTTIGSPATAANLIIDNNSVATCARGIAVQGSATTVFPGLTISNNLIGNATASAVDQVYSVGITAQGSANGSIAGNTVYIESFLPSSTSSANRAIDVGGISASGTFTIERNQVNRAKNNAPDFWLAHGINLAGGNNHVVRNNFIQNITLNTTSGGFYSTTFAAVGIRIAAGTGHQIYHNSVNMTGTITGATPTITAAYMVIATTLTGIDTRNNIFVNSLTNGSATSAHVAVYLPPSGTAAMNLTLNNNDYFNSASPAATQGVGQVGTTAGTGFFTQANFDPTTTAGATNFRSYTSTLSGTGTNDNATKKVDPQFLSATDLHIAPASPMVDMGVNVGVGTDIDGQARVGLPDIGADEPGGVTPPANDIAAVAIINPPNGSTRPAGTPFTVQASFINNGTAAQTNVTVRFKITDGSNMVVYNQTTIIASINPGQTVVATFPNATLSAGAYTTMATAELVGDQNTGNDSVNGTVTVLNPLSGNVTVGTGGAFASLTNTGGVFDALNNGGASSNIVIDITSDLTGETGTVALNELAGGFSVTIKPSGAARTITGTAANLSLIKLNGADKVTIDGSLSGGTDRSLTLTYGNTGGTVIWIASASAANGANNNTVKNCILSGNTGATIISGVIGGSGTTFGGDGETANSNNTLQNNSVFRVQNAFFLRGNGTALDQNWLITANTMGSTVAADKLLFRGMLLGNAQNFIVSNNTINGVSSTTTTSSTMSGIQIALIVSNGAVTGNKISDIKHNNTTGWGSNGIYLTSSSTAANVTIANNFVSDVASQGFNGVTDTDNGYGIVVALGGGYKIYHNSVLLNTNQGAGAANGITAAVNILAGVTTVGAVDLRDNILANTQTIGTRYAVICSAPATVFNNINYNDYFAANVGFLGSARVTLANWQTATGQDANSLAVDPLFVTSAAPADLHLQMGSPLINAGTPVGITSDIDGQTRVPPPDIGADEQAGIIVPRRQIADFDNDSKTDIAVWNPNNHNWYIRDSSTGMTRTQLDWGNGSLGDIAVPRDYDGDGKIDIAVWRPSEGNWYIIKSSDSTVQLSNWGQQGDIPVPADYDADGKADLAVFRPSEGNWYIINSSGGGTVKGWGNASDKLVPADYDGDGKADLAVFRPSEGNWYILNSFSNAGSVRNWGLSTDVPVPADYDGDGRADIAVYRNGDWFIIRSATGGTSIRNWGNPTDIAVPGDYDGDGKADLAVWRPSEGNWYIINSSGGNIVVSLGSFGDVPAPATYHPQ